MLHQIGAKKSINSMTCGAEIYCVYVKSMRTPDFSKSIHRSKVVRMLLPMPADIRAWVEYKAAHNLQPMTSVIVVALRAQMAAEQREKARQ